MKTLNITTPSGDITRQAHSFALDVNGARGDLVATGFDEQGEKTCVVIVARSEWQDATIDVTDEATETTTSVDTGEAQRVPSSAALWFLAQRANGCSNCSQQEAPRA